MELELERQSTSDYTVLRTTCNVSIFTSTSTQVRIMSSCSAGCPWHSTARSLYLNVAYMYLVCMLDCKVMV
jgi:hypothetical protein